MAKMPPTRDPLGLTPKEREAARRARADARRMAAKPWRTWYATDVWRLLRAAHLSLNPACVMCWARGILTPATVVDHVTPHRGSWALFIDPRNLQSLCATCHNADKQREERQ